MNTAVQTARATVLAGNPDVTTMRRRIQAQMEAAIKSGCGAVVEVTLTYNGRLCVSGDDAHVVAARTVMQAAGCVLESSEADDADFPGERFDYWREAA